MTGTYFVIFVFCGSDTNLGQLWKLVLLGSTLDLLKNKNIQCDVMSILNKKKNWPAF